MNTTLGQVAYEAYAGAADWKSLIHQEPLPQWHELAPPIRNGWEKAAAAVRESLASNPSLLVTNQT